MTELKPCPYCGGEARLLLNAKRKIYGKDEYKTGVVACCNVCEARMFYESEKLAIEAWNRRAKNDRCEYLYPSSMCDGGVMAERKEYIMSFKISDDGSWGDQTRERELVRCKNCKHWIKALMPDGTERIFYSYCELRHGGDGQNWFCPDGENDFLTT